MHRDHDLRIDVLGSLRAARHGADVRLGPPQRRTVLAVLLCGVRQVIATDRLVDCVWGEHAGSASVGSLHVHLSHLRRTLGSDSIVRHVHGYALAIRHDQLDADEFDHLAALGHAALRRNQFRRGRQHLAAALALWRGHAYEEFDGAPWARGEIARLDAERLGALVSRIDADLAIGERDVVGELESLVVEHPLHESFCARLMVALYRAGRQADALAQYRAHADHLVESSGLAPTPALRDLQLRILRHDERLTIPPRQADDKETTSDDEQDLADLNHHRKEER